jgi:hypothetical protein
VTFTAQQIDPRDETWEVYDPAYRVYFWDTDAACDEWELIGCDVEAALRWAREAAEGRTFTLHATVQTPGELGLIRLTGTDPTRS